MGDSSAASAVPMLSFIDVVRTYGEGDTEVTALGPVNLEVYQGEFVALMGPSGSGKSTLLSIAGALDRPTAGRVLLQERDLAELTSTELAELRRQQIGYVFQDLNLLPGLTAVENVALPLELDGVALGPARQAAMDQLQHVGLAALATRFPEELSGGERQRVAIARAFVGPRDVLLADEPTGALDSLSGEVVMELLRAQCDQGRTVVLVTHDATHAGWADRVLQLRDGNIESTSTGMFGEAPKSVATPSDSGTSELRP